MSVQTRTRPAGAPELRRPVQLIDRHGSLQARQLDPDGHAAVYVELVLEGQEGLVELVRATRDGDGRFGMRSRRDPGNYVDLDRPGAVVSLASRARGRGEEVFVTPLPRSAPEPGKAAVAPGSVCWVDLDGLGARAGGRAAPASHDPLGRRTPLLLASTGDPAARGDRGAQPQCCAPWSTGTRRVRTADGPCGCRGRSTPAGGSGAG